jgi:hypothetical protein
MLQNWKNCICTSKLALWLGFFGKFFCDKWYWYTIHQLNVESFRSLNFFIGNPIQKCVYCILLAINGYIYIYIYGKNPLPYEKIGDFIVGHGIIFSFFILG